jgi:uncharacterized protein with PQ loop repeat
MKLEPVELLVMLSGIISTTAFWPQFQKTLKSGNVKSFCPNATCLRILSTCVFLVYAFLKGLPLMFLGGLGSLFWDGWLLYKIKTSPSVDE